MCHPVNIDKIGEKDDLQGFGTKEEKGEGNEMG